MISEFQGEHRWLSNFWSVNVEYNGMTFSSVECAYQAAKCREKEIMYQFVGMKPRDAKRLGRRVKIRNDWNRVKVEVMKELLKEKFKDDELKGKLIETGDQELIEGNRWNDTFWGVCRGRGQNVLGKLLMEVRKEI